MSLIRTIKSQSSVGYGVNLFEQQPPGTLRRDGAAVVGMVADLPWGPMDEVVEVGSTAEFFDTFFPSEFELSVDDYPAVLAVLNKAFPRLRVVRASKSAAHAAFLQDQVLVAATQPSIIGNDISIEWSVNATNPNSRDLRVVIGSSYNVKYTNVAFLDGGLISISDPGDPFVTVSASQGSITLPSAGVLTKLINGNSEPAEAFDYLGSPTDSVGLRLFYDDGQDVDVTFIAEPPDALVDTLNDGLIAFATEAEKGVVVLCTPENQNYNTALAYLDTRRSDRAVYPWPKVYTVNTLAASRPLALVDGASFVAAAIAAVAPEVSPGGPGPNKINVQSMYGINSLEGQSASTNQLDALNAAGVAPLLYSRALGGAIIRRAVVTDTTPGREKVKRRRMTDFILDGVGDILQLYVEQPLDVNLSALTLGATAGAAVSGLVGFLDSLLVPGSQRIDSYALDPYSGNTDLKLASGEWVIQLSVKLFADADFIVLKANVGSTVNIDELANPV